ncbi:MAG: hypothetical protein GY838_13245 [bacterium]|nr:hypothetical protein [bacterium]
MIPPEEDQQAQILFLAVFLLLIGLLLAATAVVMASGCTPGYAQNFQPVTAYRVAMSMAKKTPGGVRFIAPAKDDTAALRAQLDAKTSALEKCLAQAGAGWQVRRDWFVVLVPPDWYISACSGQQLVPSTPSCRLCIDQKGLPLPAKCCGLRLPTKDCPCVCNMRAVVQPGQPPAVVTAPDLLLYKAELARLVTGVNFPWGDPRISRCLK